MSDGTFYPQQSRGIPPETWKMVRPLGRSYDADGTPIPDKYDPCAKTAIEDYRALWNAINDPGSWAKNPWVWRVEFRRLKPAFDPAEPKRTKSIP
jgi:hypothetical protein